MRNHTLLALAATATLLVANLSAAQEQPAQPVTVPPPAAGDTLVVPTPTSVSTPVVAVPTRGSSMEGVKTKFGAPLQEVPPVGTPAITRWEYTGFAVFFENDKVLHTVIAR